MTSRTSGRLAGFTFLFYIAIAITEMILSSRITSGPNTAAKLANIAQHLPQMRLVTVLVMLTIFCALVLAVTLYALTRDVDADLALMAMTCRITEGVTGIVPAIAKLGLLSLATTAVTAKGTEAATVNELAALLLRVGGWSTTVGATAFAVGSTIFAYLFLRARSIPVWLAWVGLAGSLLMVVILPLEGIGLIKGAITAMAWAPLFVFEVTLGFWLMIKGVSPRPAL
ncbi:MAG TPA: DUF4386 domain-containing protein [Bradyrhizobium sp.]|nr:DUF4386 domain-containing protein [Bradyrhizobium sp.]